MSAPRRIIVGISGASCAADGLRIVELLATTDCEIHLVVSATAERTSARFAMRVSRRICSRTGAATELGASASLSKRW